MTFIFSKPSRPSRLTGTLSKQKSDRPIAEGSRGSVPPLQRFTSRATAAGDPDSRLPERLRLGLESLSGMSLDHVRVKFNSPMPSLVGAHAFTRGHEIHLGRGQERHLAHEGWHTVQQARGRVRSNGEVGGHPLNDDPTLETEADVMGRRAQTASTALIGSVRNLVAEAPAAGDGDRGAMPVSITPVASPASPLPVMQRVGGPKLGVKAAAGVSDNPAAMRQLEILKATIGAEQARRRTAKRALEASYAHDARGLADDQRRLIHRQNQYSEDLGANEINYSRLEGFRRDGNRLIARDGDHHVADLLEGDEAYDRQPTGSGEMMDVFKRHRLEQSDKEYVKVNGSYLRRHAFRGITPVERADYYKRRDLVPEEAGRTRGEVGWHANDDGSFNPRKRKNPANDDLTWINDLARTDRERLDGTSNRAKKVRAFVHAGKGVNKLFSMTSTGGQINSNSVGDFNRFGKIKVDLAKIPSKNFFHHYRNGPIDGDDILDEMGQKRLGSYNFEPTRTRTNNAILRNREIMVDKIPDKAVMGIKESQSRKDYEKEFAMDVDEQWNDERKFHQKEHGVDIGPMPIEANQLWSKKAYTKPRGRGDAARRKVRDKIRRHADDRSTEERDAKRRRK